MQSEEKGDAEEDQRNQAGVTIGPEKIRLKSISYDDPTKSVAIKVDTEPNADKAEAVIVAYGS